MWSVFFFLVGKRWIGFVFEFVIALYFVYIICNWIVEQVVDGNLLPEAVTWLYTSALKGLQMHGQHEGCNAALTQLAWFIYETLVRLTISAFKACTLLWCGLKTYWRTKVSLLFAMKCAVFISLQRPRYVELRSIMNQIPDIHIDALEQFDQKTIQPAVTKAAEKKRKDQFKRLIAGTVGVRLLMFFF